MGDNKQQDFYDNYYSGRGKSFNLIGQLWGGFRRRFIASTESIENQVHTLVRDIIHQTAGGNILEIGCGDGSPVSLNAAKEAGHCTFNELSSQGIARLKEKLSAEGVDTTNVEFIAGDFMDHEYDRKFDLIILFAVFHHLPDPEAAIVRLRSLLSEKGRLVIFDPLTTNPVMRGVRFILDRLRNNADWERPMSLYKWKKFFPLFHKSEAHLFYGLTCFAFVFPGKFRDSILKKLDGFDKKVCSKRAWLQWVFIKGVFIFHSA